jgi:hypothetical protein
MAYFGTNIYLSTAGMSVDTLRCCSTLLNEGAVLPVAASRVIRQA